MQIFLLNRLQSNGLAFVIILLFVLSAPGLAQDWSRIINLEGKWKFALGDDNRWAEPGYQDSQWEELKVPSSWEEEGYHGYNGFAWYRKHFDYSSELEKGNIYLDLGYIDDVDEVYLNGKLVGSSGSFWPDYSTAAGVRRRYAVSLKIFKKGDNVLSVRVFDSYSRGGIYSGDVGIYILENALVADINLEGKWMFKKGDNEDWKKIVLNTSDWEAITVPGYWDNKYDGFAWYRKEFALDKGFNTDKLILMLGKIDDIDEAYINGEIVGVTGYINKDTTKIKCGGEAADFRCYAIPSYLLKKGEKNIIAVRVYDGLQQGGIYSGPVGIIGQEKYRKYWKGKNHNILDDFFGIR